MRVSATGGSLEVVVVPFSSFFVDQTFFELWVGLDLGRREFGRGEW